MLVKQLGLFTIALRIEDGFEFQDAHTERLLILHSFSSKSNGLTVSSGLRVRTILSYTFQELNNKSSLYNFIQSFDLNLSKLVPVVKMNFSLLSISSLITLQSHQDSFAAATTTF